MRDWLVGLSFGRLTFVLEQWPFAELRNSMETAFLHEATVLLLRTQHLGLLSPHTRFLQQKQVSCFPGSR